jgi:hypothetical protein
MVCRSSSKWRQPVYSILRFEFSSIDAVSSTKEFEESAKPAA